MRLIPLTRIDNCKVTSRQLRAVMAICPKRNRTEDKPEPPDHTAQLLDWFGRLDSRIKVAVLTAAYLFAVWCGCTPG